MLRLSDAHWHMHAFFRATKLNTWHTARAPLRVSQTVSSITRVQIVKVAQLELLRLYCLLLHAHSSCLCIELEC